MMVIGLIGSGTLNAADLQDGIFGYQWGDNLSQLEGFSKLRSSLHVDYYSKPGEVYTINDVVVSEVIYGTYSDQFFAVYIRINTIEVFDELRRYMKEKYGCQKCTACINAILIASFGCSAIHPRACSICQFMLFISSL